MIVIFIIVLLLLLLFRYALIGSQDAYIKNKYLFRMQFGSMHMSLFCLCADVSAIRVI